MSSAAEPARRWSTGSARNAPAAGSPSLRSPSTRRWSSAPVAGPDARTATGNGPGELAVVTATDLAPFLVIHPEVGVREVRWEERQATATVRTLVGHARVSFRGIERNVELAVDVRLVSRSCPECSRKSGRYYTAIVQLRGPSERLIEKSRDLRARLDRRWTELLRDTRPDWQRAMSWREERPEGWDVYFTETLAARSVARLAKQKFGIRPVESATLFGRKDGRDVYRVTFCLRFPRQASDDDPAAAVGGAAEPLEP